MQVLIDMHRAMPIDVGIAVQAWYLKLLPGVPHSQLEAWYLGFCFIYCLIIKKLCKCSKVGPPLQSHRRGIVHMVLPSLHSLQVGQKWVRLCNRAGLDTEASIPTGWTFVTLLLWIAMVSPTSLISISACSVPNFNTMIHSNGKKRCSYML
jgi:hypothetical protein